MTLEEPTREKLRPLAPLTLEEARQILHLWIHHQIPQDYPDIEAAIAIINLAIISMRRIHAHSHRTKV